MSTPTESQCLSRIPYLRTMGKNRAWEEWGFHFRLEMRAKHVSTRDLAEKLDLAESTVRSWLNGNREINLSDFFILCAAAGIDPATVLFTGQVDPRFLSIQRAWARAEQGGKELLLVAAEAAERMSDAAGSSGSEAGKTKPRRN